MDMADAGVVEVTDQSFDAEVLNSETPTIIDFWAEWCAPCRAIAPIVKDLADQYGDKVKIAKLNIDENPSVPGRYGIRSIPTVLAFKDGAVVDQITGARPKSAFEQMVEKLL
jgi:thioredoxin 1